ncbi:uncharacterized protein F5Z01DRAFT_629682, partial [Emericellopsis atlantica]
SFLDLPSELRNTIYELLLLRSTSINPWHRVRYELVTGLFRASKKVHHEVTSLFYGQNRFDFTHIDPQTLALFLEQIGSQNSGYIRHILIEFPDFLYLDPGDVTLNEGSVSLLAGVQRSYGNLSSLTTSLHSTNALEQRLDQLDHFGVAAEALELVNARFRAISSTQEIILEVYENRPGYQVRKKMEDLGWKFSTSVYVEEED